MDDMKAWYQSKTVWGALIAVGSSLLQIKGIELSADMQADLANIAVTLAGVAGGLLAISGRLRAATGIRGK
ncbi:hypothetical protein [Neorhizobium sp. S3-V5DH]|jgi:uncharacterized membrane protein|uniref:hypothetical protein n=1 Tax=Neorhizobium sp. S3-V5DH TaxID=2485166 RepID=UPI001051194C|nr:hypothetical protein [Neorhizobium sp. S3-V5DH]TCV71491.1 hypothetical protein EDE09_106194 [Neorhizobium sp. S3-V5DH]